MKLLYCTELELALWRNKVLYIQRYEKEIISCRMSLCDMKGTSAVVEE